VYYLQRGKKKEKGKCESDSTILKSEPNTQKKEEGGCQTVSKIHGEQKGIREDVRKRGQGMKRNGGHDQPKVK